MSPKFNKIITPDFPKPLSLNSPSTIKNSPLVKVAGVSAVQVRCLSVHFKRQGNCIVRPSQVRTKLTTSCNLVLALDSARDPYFFFSSKSSHFDNLLYSFSKVIITGWLSISVIKVSIFYALIILGKIKYLTWMFC